MSGKKGGNKIRTCKLFKNLLAFEPYLKIANHEKRRIMPSFELVHTVCISKQVASVITILIFHLTGGYANVALWANPKMNSTF